MYCIVFKGEILPGYRLQEVQQSAELQFKLLPEQVKRMFSGKPVVLKKGLPVEKARQYLEKLNRIGLHVYAQREETPDSVPEAPVAAGATFADRVSSGSRNAARLRKRLATTHIAQSSPHFAPTSAFATQEAQLPLIFCPACGTKQPQYACCSDCGQALGEAQAEEDGIRSTPEPRFFGFGLSGRIGRMTFLTMLLLVWSATLLHDVSMVSWGASIPGGIVLSILIRSACSFWFGRAIKLRCNDLNMGAGISWAFALFPAHLMVTSIFKIPFLIQMQTYFGGMFFIVLIFRFIEVKKAGSMQSLNLRILGFAAATVGLFLKSRKSPELFSLCLSILVLVVLLWFTFAPAKKEANQYGPVPEREGAFALILSLIGAVATTFLTFKAFMIFKSF